MVVYTHYDAERYWGSLAGERIHRPESLELYGLDRALVGAMVSRLERRMAFELSVTHGMLYLTIDHEMHSCALATYRLVGSGDR